LRYVWGEGGVLLLADGVLHAANVDGCCARRVGTGAARGRGEWGRVLRAASVGIALSPSSRVVVLLKSDFLAYYY